MPLAANRIYALAQIIATHVGLDDLADIVAQGNYVKNFDELLRVSLNPPALKKFTIAHAVVNEYNDQDAVDLLKAKLRRKLWANDVFAAAMADFEDDEETGGNHEAAIARRARTLRLPELRQFLAEHESKICVIAGVAELGDGKTRFVRGTGFLAGDSLVVTARHVLRYHVQGGVPKKPSPGPLYAFFDHLDGAPISDPRDPKIAARRVDFADDWLQDFSDLVEDDGKNPDPLTSLQIDELARNLDMVLIKLAEPIGAYSRWRSGGPRRGWVTLPDEKVPASLAFDDRILIPQHPEGEAQQIDIGRYKATDASLTRIRYNTETDKGTSGAPCFNQHFQLVGMHNSYFKPPGASEVLNQAIRFDHILKRIKARIPSALPLTQARLWSVSEDPARPEVIIGRRLFLSWIQDAFANDLASRKERVYVAEAKWPKCGASFSLPILKAALRGKSDPVIVMGTDRQTLPSTPLDFVAVIAEQLNIPAREIANLPERADGNFRVRSPDGDKTNLYPARDVPRWIKDALSLHRVVQVDQREIARKQIDRDKKAGRDPNAEDVRVEALATPVLIPHQRWERIWIVLDNAKDSAFSEEVSALLVKLIGKTGESEDSINEELRRIRWLFLGSKPRFIDEATVEILDQMVLPDEDIEDCIRAFAESFNSLPTPEILKTVLEFIVIRRLGEASKTVYENSATRLRFLQAEIADVRNYFRKQLGAGGA